MPTYFRKMPSMLMQDEIWYIDDDLAAKVEGSPPIPGIGNYYQRGDHPTIWHALEEQTGWLKVEEPESNPFKILKFDQKEFHPRIYRPTIPDISITMRPPLKPPHEESVVSTNIGQAISLTRRLETIFQTIHPDKRNMETFGHEIRSLLILACTEIESHWRGILKSNGYNSEKYNTNDYVKILPVMKLDEYTIKFPRYPFINPISPFQGWSKSNPTKSLVWYDAYNATKHDRENEFEKASLSNAILAVSACVVMQVAQFGRIVGLDPRSELSAFFHFESAPHWDPFDCYIGQSFGKDWTQILAKFDN